MSDKNKKKSENVDPDKFNYLYNARIIAGDGAFLGIISRDKEDTNSIFNTHGNYGNEHSASSIFNPAGKYGNKFNKLSPFNELSDTPPEIVKGKIILGYLTLNKFIKNRVDTIEFVHWLSKQKR